MEELPAQARGGFAADSMPLHDCLCRKQVTIIEFGKRQRERRCHGTSSMVCRFLLTRGSLRGTVERVVTREELRHG